MSDNYYRDHWLAIEPERLARYEAMFQWRPEQEDLLSALDLRQGMTVLDYGCGPGFLSMEMATRVGPGGQVTGLDINEEFVSRANARAKESGLAGQLEFRTLVDQRLPVDASSVDRVLCKNVLEYVANARDTLHSIRNCMKPGARILIVDSDWGFVIVEPWGRDRVERFFKAASPAFKEPYIGRKLLGLLNEAGLSDAEMRVSAVADTKGTTLGLLTNMCSYIKTFNGLDSRTVADMMQELDDAIESGHYLFVLPQFLVTATR